jgi:hypothetical protein
MCSSTGRRTTEWSTNGDGDTGYVKIALVCEARLGAIEMWTRPMSDDTAQIYKFALTTNSGHVLGRLSCRTRANPTASVST